MASFLRTGSSHGRWSDPRDAGDAPQSTLAGRQGPGRRGARGAQADDGFHSRGGGGTRGDQGEGRGGEGYEFPQGTRFRKSPEGGLVLAIGLAFLQQASGINAIFYYAPEIISEIGLNDWKFQLTAALSLINVLATFIAIFLVDRLGRRPLLIAGTALMMVSQITVGVASTWLPKATGDAAAASGGSMVGTIMLIAIFISVIAFACSLGPLVWLVISEIFPAGVRSACVGVATSVNWVGNFFIAQETLTLVNISPGLAFWIFAGFNLITIIFVWFLMPETKGVELEKIEDFFKGKQARQGLLVPVDVWGTGEGAKNGFLAAKATKSGGKCPVGDATQGWSTRIIREQARPTG